MLHSSTEISNLTIELERATVLADPSVASLQILHSENHLFDGLYSKDDNKHYCYDDIKTIRNVVAHFPYWSVEHPTIVMHKNNRLELFNIIIGKLNTVPPKGISIDVTQIKNNKLEKLNDILKDPAIARVYQMCRSFEAKHIIYRIEKVLESEYKLIIQTVADLDVGRSRRNRSRELCVGNVDSSEPRIWFSLLLPLCIWILSVDYALQFNATSLELQEIRDLLQEPVRF